MKRTKIVCTLGPAAQSVAVLKRMLRAGMNVARLNFSHGTYADHAMLIKNLREASRQTKLPVALLQDLQGPRVRLGVLPKKGVELVAGAEIVLVYGTDYSLKEPRYIPIDFPLFKHVKPGYKIFIQDGLIAVKVVRVRAKQMHARVLQGGVVYSHKGMNIPQASFARSAFTAKDKKDVAFGLKQGVDFIALSFVESAGDILSLRRFLQKSTPRSRVGHRPQIIAKIERPAAVRDFAGILNVADAVMVARGDLGIEMPLHRVPIIEKDVIRACLRAGKPVIVATQMLESMVQSPRPTRAEVSDVANAVIDHTDAVMLSEETAVGKYPVEAVKMMHDVAVSAEHSRYDNVALDFFGHDGVTLAENVSEVLKKYSGTKKVHVKALLVEASDANVSRMIARQRIELPVFAFTHDRLVYHQLLLSWGIVPVLMPHGLKQDWNVYAFRWLRDQRVVRKGDLLAFVYKRGEVVTKFY